MLDTNPGSVAQWLRARLRSRRFVVRVPPGALNLSDWKTSKESFGVGTISCQTCLPRCKSHVPGVHVKDPRPEITVQNANMGLGFKSGKNWELKEPGLCSGSH